MQTETGGLVRRLESLLPTRDPQLLRTDTSYIPTGLKAESDFEPDSYSADARTCVRRAVRSVVCVLATSW